MGLQFLACPGGGNHAAVCYIHSSWKVLAIRRAKQSDKESIWRIHTSAIREVCRQRYTEEQVEGWSSLLKPNSYEEVIETREFFVAEKDGAIVGFGQLNLEKGEVESVYVSPEKLGCGIGYQLLQTLEQKAIAHGLSKLQLSSNLNAVGFYERAGFNRLHDSKHSLSNGMELPCVFMEKTL